MDKILSDYETDFQFVLSEAARCTLEKNKTEIEFERSLNLGMIIAFKSAAYMMYFRLSERWPAVYIPRSVAETQENIQQRVANKIEEMIDHEQKTQPLS